MSITILMFSFILGSALVAIIADRIDRRRAARK